MSLIKTMGASPLTGNIFQGTLNTETSRWIGKKTDVTTDVLRASAESLYYMPRECAYQLKDGRTLVLSVEIREPEGEAE